MVRSQLRPHLREEVQSRVHPANVDQETDHGHVMGSLSIDLQSVLEDLACLGASGQAVDVDLGKVATRLSITDSGENGFGVLDDNPQELVLDFLSPKRCSVRLLDMPDLAARVDRANCPIRLPPGAYSSADCSEF